jgi:hypothetical protein
MFTMENTEGFIQSDLGVMNVIADGIAAANPCIDRKDVDAAVCGSFDPNLSASENEHWALSQLGLA